MGAGPEEAYATVEQVEAALAHLSTADVARIDRAALYHCYGNPMIEPLDLRNEAIRRVLEGTRRWPLAVKFTTFLSNVMRSLADEYDRQYEERPAVSEAELVPIGADAEIIENAPSETPDPEQIALDREVQRAARQMVNEIMGLFEGDEEVLAILMGRMEEWPAARIREEFGMSATQYATALRRLRRALDKKYPGGRPS